VRRRMDEVLAKHTGKPVEQIHEDTERDFFMGATEAADYGIIDRVVSHR
jgi:ATP-dependent Clp protease, protease subunit